MAFDLGLTLTAPLFSACVGWTSSLIFLDLCSVTTEASTSEGLYETLMEECR